MAISSLKKRLYTSEDWKIPALVLVMSDKKEVEISANLEGEGIIPLPGNILIKEEYRQNGYYQSLVDLGYLSEPVAEYRIGTRIEAFECGLRV